MTTPNPIAETSTLQAPYWNGSQWVRDVSSPEEILAGDTVLVMVGGGNRVTAYPGGVWQQLNYQTGQEAQGFVMAATFTADAGFPTWTLSFDGTDKSMVSIVHLRVPDVRFVVDDFSRQGSVGVTRPAESLPLTGAGKDDTEYYLAFVRNSGGTYPSTTDADAVFQLSNGNEGASLFRRQPTEDATTSLDLPSCTGHYAVAVGLYVPVWGDWRDDSDEIWTGGPSAGSLSPAWSDATATSSNTRIQSSSGFDEPTPQAAADVAWAGTESVSLGPGPGAAPRFFLEDSTAVFGAVDYTASWSASFASLARASGTLTGFTSGTLPDAVQDPVTGDYVDPDVLDVEWETSPTPVGQRLRLHVETQPTPNGTPNTRSIHTIYGIIEDPAAPLGPTTFTTPSSIKSGTPIFTTSATPATTGAEYTSEDYNYEGGLLGTDPSAALRLRLVALDHTTDTGVAFTPPIDGTEVGGELLHLTANLEQRYRPRYRLLYRHGVTVTTSVTRLWPRDDAQGLGTANRIVPPPRANRIIGRQP